ncbi:MAG: hypothetical protein M0P14_06890 [Alkaliphilus sp.]|jgi:Spy/CpxP family protein refolding chaperone|nr:hypothetical protein [Alkaliphilus sp.]MDD3819266.1 hypothetical protein [Actinomycetota bacterium]MDX9799330.1 hypothetical protein [Bacteroidales bacterium]
MRKKVIFLTLIVVVLMVLSIVSFADVQKHGHRNFAGKQVAPYHNKGQGQLPTDRFNFNHGDSFSGMRNLELTTEQMAQIREMMLEFQKETLELRNQIHVKQLELRELGLSTDLDLNSVKAKLEEISRLQLGIRMKAFERQEKIKELLTPEQLENCKGLKVQKFGSKMDRYNSKSNRGYERRNCW